MDTLIHEPITDRELTFEDALVRLRFAGKMASDLPVENYKRWLGWFTFQTGHDLPGDLFYKYACALDWHQNAPAEDALDSSADVLHYEAELSAILAGRLRFGLGR